METELCTRTNPRPKTPPATAKWPRPRATGRIFVTTVDPDLRCTVVSALRSAGFGPLPIATSYELLERLVFERRQVRDLVGVDLVICEAQTAAPSGLDLLSYVRARDLVTPYFLISTSRDPKVVHEGLRRGATSVLQTPLSLEELIHKVHTVVPTVCDPLRPTQKRRARRTAAPVPTAA